METEKFYEASYSVGAPFSVKEVPIGWYVADRIGNNVGRSSMGRSGGVFFSTEERARICCEFLNKGE